MYKSISNFELEDLAVDIGVPLLAVVSKDQLRGQPRDGGYIVNLQDHMEGPGSHWVALYVEHSKAAYFDSFGGACPDDVKSFVKGAKKKFNFYATIDQIQHLESEACGYFCLAYLHYMYNNQHIEFTMRLNQFIAMFDTRDLDSNEEVLTRYFSVVKIYKRK